jgi:hypothetical protein
MLVHVLPFGIFYGHWICIPMSIWYNFRLIGIFWPFWYVCWTKKSGNPAVWRRSGRMRSEISSSVANFVRFVFDTLRFFNAKSRDSCCIFYCVAIFLKYFLWFRDFLAVLTVSRFSCSIDSVAIFLQYWQCRDFLAVLTVSRFSCSIF